uniref:Preprotein translocase subunit SECE1 n=2 Tax=Anthurium amnicola TaxID=1678845 RepID=A0A1D1Z4R7_9ARAE
MVTAASVGYRAGSVCLTGCRLPFPSHRVETGHLGSRKILRMPILRYSSMSRRTVCATGGRGYREQLQFGDEHAPEPFWLSLIKDVIWSFRSLVGFLADQPRQLKYIEWPSFQSTLKTAALTLVIVALLIVALSSIDSALCYLLSLLLRRTARPLS